MQLGLSGGSFDIFGLSKWTLTALDSQGEHLTSLDSRRKPLIHLDSERKPLTSWDSQREPWQLWVLSQRTLTALDFQWEPWQLWNLRDKGRCFLRPQHPTAGLIQQCGGVAFYSWHLWTLRENLNAVDSQGEPLKALDSERQPWHLWTIREILWELWTLRENLDIFGQSERSFDSQRKPLTYLDSQGKPLTSLDSQRQPWQLWTPRDKGWCGFLHPQSPNAGLIQQCGGVTFCWKPAASATLRILSFFNISELQMHFCICHSQGIKVISITWQGKKSAFARDLG